MTPTQGQVDFTPSPSLFPFTSQWFDSSVGRVHYIDEGSGRPILLGIIDDSAQGYRLTGPWALSFP